MSWDWIAVAGYIVIVGALIAWEVRGLRSSTDRWPTLTELVKRWVPRPVVIIGGIGLGIFFVVHFAVQS